MKETFYFSHDYNASQDAKILNMRSVLGWEGYGLYWQLVERLAEANGKLSFEDIKGISFACCVDESKLISLINDFSLFEKDNTHFWSKRLFEHLKKREKLSKDRAKIGRIGGQAKAKQLLSKSQAKVWQNVAKERKGKESKVKEISIAEASSAEVIPNLLNDKQRHIQIIGLYAEAKKIFFENVEQQRAFIRRNLRASQDLKGYDFEKIIEVMKYLSQNADFKWTLESVGKFITEDLNNLNARKSRLAIIN